MAIQGPPVVVVGAGGIPVTNTTDDAPFTVSAKGFGIPVTVVDEGGTPVTLMNEDGTAWEPAE